MASLTVCCLVLDLDQYMDLILIPVNVLNYAYTMVKCLLQRVDTVGNTVLQWVVR